MEEKDKYLETAKDYIGLLRREGIDVKKAYLFGSAASGTTHRWSDLDTCVVSSSFGEDRLENRVRLMHLANRVSDLIEPHPFRPEDFEDRYNSLANEVKKTGIPLA